VALPEHVAAGDIVLRSRRMVSSGHVENVGYVVYVDPEQYQKIGSAEVRRSSGGSWACSTCGWPRTFHPRGAWSLGQLQLELGLPVTYGDIYNARLLVEIALAHGEHPPEASYGTHFFQDLVESDILPLPIYPGEEDAFVNFEFFRSSENVLARSRPNGRLWQWLKVIDVRVRLQVACSRSS